MRLAGSSSWRISEDRWPESFDVALWFRAAELPAGWLAWWHARRALTGRWRQAQDWHNARLEAGLKAALHYDARTGQVVVELERELGRKARPFSLDLVLLPVRDEQIRSAGADHYLIPERVHDGPRWPGLLRGLLIPRA